MDCFPTGIEHNQAILTIQTVSKHTCGQLYIHMHAFILYTTTRLAKDATVIHTSLEKAVSELYNGTKQLTSGQETVNFYTSNICSQSYST